MTVVHDSVTMRPTKVALIKLTEQQIRSLAGFLGFLKDLKQLTKDDLPDAFLAALDAHCDGEVPDYVLNIGRATTVNDSMADLRARVATAAERVGGRFCPIFNAEKKSKGGPSAAPLNPQESPEVLLKNPRRSLRLVGKSAEMELEMNPTRSLIVMVTTTIPSARQTIDSRNLSLEKRQRIVFSPFPVI